MMPTILLPSRTTSEEAPERSRHSGSGPTGTATFAASEFGSRLQQASVFGTNHPLTVLALIVVMIETIGCRTWASPERQSFYRTRTGIISTESCTSSPSP
jgi:hypothetical protein